MEVGPIPFIILAIPVLIIIGVELYKNNIGKSLSAYVNLWIYYGIYCAVFLGAPIFAALGSLTGCLICFFLCAFMLIGGKLVVYLISKFVKLLEIMHIIPLEHEETITTQGKIIKAVVENHTMKENPMNGYYYLVVKYIYHGKSHRAKTRRSYSLAEIAAILRKSNMVDITVKKGECELPIIPKEEIKGIYDRNDLKAIKIRDGNFVWVGKLLYIPLYCKVLPFVIVIPFGIIYSYNIFLSGQLLWGIIIVFVLTFASFCAIVDFIRDRRKLKEYIEQNM